MNIVADPKLAHVAKNFPAPAPALACRFDPTGKFVFGACEDRSIQRWDFATGAKVEAKGHDSWVFSLGFTQAGKELVTGGGDGKLMWWSAAEPLLKAIRTVDAHQGWVRCLAVSADGAKIATGGNDFLVKTWTQDGKPISVLRGHQTRVYSLLFLPDGRLVSGDLHGKVFIWDLATGKIVNQFDAKPLHTYEAGQQVDFGGVRSIGLSPDRTKIAFGGLHKATNPLGAVSEPLVLLFDFATQKKLQAHVAPPIVGAVARTLFHTNGALMAVTGGSAGGFVLFFQSSQEKDTHRFQLPSLARDMDLSADGLHLATAHYDNHVRITRLAAKT